MDINDYNLNLLKNFYRVAKEGNISKTAEKYYTSQPAISRSIKQLEDIYSAQLFYRTLNGVELTEKGKILFDSVEKIFSQINQTEFMIKEQDNLESGKLSIGCPSQIASINLFDSVSKFHKLYPNIEISIVSKSTNELMKSLENHELNFVIDTTPVSTNTKYTEIKIASYENCFFVNKTFLDTNLSKIKHLKDLENFPLILPISGTANRNNLDNLFKKYDVKISNYMNIHFSDMIISAVKKESGIGYCLKDLIAEDVKYGELSVVNIQEELPKIDVVLVYDEKNLSHIAKTFINKFLKIEI